MAAFHKDTKMFQTAKGYFVPSKIETLGATVRHVRRETTDAKSSLKYLVGAWDTVSDKCQTLQAKAEGTKSVLVSFMI